MDLNPNKNIIRKDADSYITFLIVEMKELPHLLRKCLCKLDYMSLIQGQKKLYIF